MDKHSWNRDISRQIYHTEGTRSRHRPTRKIYEFTGFGDKQNQQDWTLIRGEQTSGETILEFKRKFKSCDYENDIDILPVSLTLVTACLQTLGNNQSDLCLL
jgi:hypothetical protein